MDASRCEPAQPSRLRLLLDPFSRIEDKRSPEGVAHKLNEIRLLCICATVAECDSFEAISGWGSAALEFLRRFLAFDWGVPSGRWLNIVINRIDPNLFAACFMDGSPPSLTYLHLLILPKLGLRLRRQQPFGSRAGGVDDKTNETTAIPRLLEKLAAGRSLEGVVTIDAIACKAPIAQSIRDAGADYLLAVKGKSAVPAGRYRGRLRDRRQGLDVDRRPRPHRDPLRLGVAAD